MNYPEKDVEHVKNWLVSGKYHADKKTRVSLSRIINLIEEKETKEYHAKFNMLMLIIVTAIILILGVYFYTWSIALTLIVTLFILLFIVTFIAKHKMEYFVIILKKVTLLIKSINRKDSSDEDT